MKIFQFKRKNSQNNTNSPELTAGEMFVFPSEEKIRIGKQESIPTSVPGTYFEIKSKLNLGDTVYNANDISSGYSLGQAFVGISGSGTNFSLVRMNGQQVPLNVTISSTAEYAKKLVTSGTSGYTVGADTTDAIKPIWFSGGIPKEFTKSSGSDSKPVYIDKGVVKPVTKLNINYIAGSTIAGSTIVANILRIGASGTPNALLAYDRSDGYAGTVGVSPGCGDSSHPIYINPQGIPALCSSINASTANQLNYQGATNKTIKADGTTTCISLNMQAGRWHLVNGRYNHNSKILTYSFLIYISSVSSNTAPDYDFSTNCIGGSGTFYDMMLVRAGDKLWCQRSGSVITTTSQHYELTNVICTRL